jgi:hypothetical protein
MTVGSTGKYVGEERVTACGRCRENQSVGILSVVSAYLIYPICYPTFRQR